MSASCEIRALLAASKHRYFGNDSIADVMMPGDLQRIEQDVTEAVRSLLDALVIDHEHDHNTHETPQRVARMLVRETFAGRYNKPPTVTAFENVRKVDQLSVVGPIAVRSCCAHHLVPIIGQAWVGVIPDPASLIGLSKHHRLIEWVLARPQIQEEAAEQVADEIQTATGAARAIGVVIRAKHLCCSWRGVRDADSMMTTSVMRGMFKEDHKARAEFLDLINGMGFR